ncbi:hypothetical protein ABPG72_021109 [Tetrahymena utriculariae]
MTHHHLITLGQCLVSLSQQGIKYPFYRVLQFINAGAIVSSTPKPQSSLLPLHSSEQVAPTPKIKVDFSKASSMISQINDTISNSHVSLPPSQSEQQVDTPVLPPLSQLLDLANSNIQVINEYPLPSELPIPIIKDYDLMLKSFSNPTKNLKADLYSICCTIRDCKITHVIDELQYEFSHQECFSSFKKLLKAYDQSFSGPFGLQSYRCLNCLLKFFSGDPSNTHLVQVEKNLYFNCYDMYTEYLHYLYFCGYRQECLKIIQDLKEKYDPKYQKYN